MPARDRERAVGDRVSAPLSHGDWLFISPNLAVDVSRLLMGERAGLEPQTLAEAAGMRISESRLSGSVDLAAPDDVPSDVTVVGTSRPLVTSEE